MFWQVQRVEQSVWIRRTWQHWWKMQRKGAHLPRSEKKAEYNDMMLVKCYLRAGRSSDTIRGFPLSPKKWKVTLIMASPLQLETCPAVVFWLALHLRQFMTLNLKLSWMQDKTARLVFERYDLFWIPKGASLRRSGNVSRFTQSLESKAWTLQSQSTLIHLRCIFQSWRKWPGLDLRLIVAEALCSLCSGDIVVGQNNNWYWRSLST